MNSIHLLDCNHKSSAEFLGGNRSSPALFTNKLGSGIQVNAGDKVSIHNAFISEVGSDDNAIQITDDFITNKTQTYTTLTKKRVVNGSGNKVLGYEQILAENNASTTETRANKCSLLINYYKTNNGENHFNLPRRFCYKNEATVLNDWKQYDDIATGQINGSVILNTSLNASFNNNNMSQYYVEDDYFFFGVINRAFGFRPKNNNARFQIMIAKDTRYGSQSVTLDRLTNASFNTPAVLDYIEYIEKVDIEIPTGFKSPEALADNLTEQLRKQSQPKINELDSKSSLYSASLVLPKQTGVEINSPTYHTFYAGSEYTQNENMFNDFETAVTANTDNASVNAYLSSYQYIGVKRPELWLRGREWANFYKDYRNEELPPGFDIQNITGAYLTTHKTINASEFRRTSTLPNAHTIVFSQEWDFNILSALNKIFLEQAKHPELFENKHNQLSGYTTVNNSRFLHANALSNDLRPTEIRFELGSDYMFANASALPYLMSVPLFFDFNPEYENIYTEGTSWEDGYSFGCFLKYNDGGKNYIAITTSHLGITTNASLDINTTTIPNHLFSTFKNGSTGNFKIEAGKWNIGWDCHFGSYGNVCIGLLDGWANKGWETAQVVNMLPTQFSTTEIQSSKFSQQIYLGANEPQIEYNTTSNRFEISNLHSPERVQNRYNAGGTAHDSAHDTFIVNEFATAGDKVYKINKRLYNTNFTPNILPYDSNRIDDLDVGGDRYQVDFLNPNLSPWTIYDQLTGIIIKDFGYTEETFENGIWGVLGFTFNQFNASRTSENDLTTRIGNDNKDNLPYALTNANVGQLSTMDFVTNIFGAGMYSLQLPSTMCFDKVNSGGSLNTSFRENVRYQQYPAITESATSVKLTAPNLPRKLINPYFTIRSDILDNSDYIGGGESGNKYQVIGVVPKSNDYGDFFVNTSPDLEFVFTKPKMITSVRTEITNPDQTLASVNDSSAIIYKITKAIPETRFNIIKQILEENKK